jgi:hypothetical protein
LIFWCTLNVARGTAVALDFGSRTTAVTVEIVQTDLSERADLGRHASLELVLSQIQVIKG